MSPRETILEALQLVLSGIPGARVLRNEPLPGRIPPGGMVILRDGDPGQPEVTLSPLRYHYEHRTGIDVLIQKVSGRDAAFDALNGSTPLLTGTSAGAPDIARPAPGAAPTAPPG